MYFRQECSEDKRYTKKVLKKAGASIRWLNPQLKEGLLRVGGRLVNAPFGDERKHPIILPYKHHVTDLIIKQCPENWCHMGQESVLSSLRERDGLDCEREIGDAAVLKEGV